MFIESAGILQCRDMHYALLGYRAFIYTAHEHTVYIYSAYPHGICPCAVYINVDINLTVRGYNVCGYAVSGYKK